MNDRILEWLRTGRDEAEDIIDLPWEVKKVGETHYVAEHPKIPFLLNIVFADDFIRLAVPSGIETMAMRLEERLKTYHTLLVLNERMNMLKFTLSGMNDEITLRVDLDEKSLEKEEFNDALTALLVGMNVLMNSLGLTEEFREAIFERLSMLIIERLQRGMGEAEILSFLTKKVGLNREEARALLSEIKKVIKGDDEMGYL